MRYHWRMTSDTTLGVGPFLRAAFMCDQVIEGKDNVNSYVRVVDRVVLSTEAHAGLPGAGQASANPEQDGGDHPSLPELPEVLPQFPWGTVLVLMFVGGSARGRQTLRLDMETPDGLKAPLGGPVDVHFDGRPNALVNLHVRLGLELKAEGLHWIHVTLDNRRMTQVPLDVMYQRR